MTPKFILPAGYVTRTVQLVLSRSISGKGWKFYGRDHQGYCVPARNPKGEPLCANHEFATKAEAAIMARALSLPAYAVWNGRTKRYDGTGAEFVAVARDASAPALAPIYAPDRVQRVSAAEVFSNPTGWMK